MVIDVHNHNIASQTGTPRYQARILIKHPSIDPKLISDVLDLKPDICWKYGEERKTPKGTILPGTHKMSVWSHSFRVLGRKNFSQSIKDIIDLFENNKLFIENISISGGSVELIIDIPGDINVGDTIKYSDLFRICNLRVNLGFEVFPDFLRPPISSDTYNSP